MHRSIFVSSTFRDMHLERDAIHTRIIPALNTEAKKFGDSVSACDLRWGIDTAGMGDVESSKKVLNVCLGEIDRCRPYMIVLLGYRYGWIPDKELITQTIKDTERFLQDARDISVTALEIEYGALSHLENIDHTLFYFREIDGPYSDIYQAEDALHREKLNALKTRIQAIPGAKIRTYHVNLERQQESMQTFSTMVTRDLYALMKQEWESNEGLDAYAIDQKRQLEFLEEKNAQFLSRQELLQECNNVLLQKQQNLLLHGQTGSGKSTIISRIGKEQSQLGVDVVPMFCGYTNLTGSGFDILQYIIYEMERRLGITEHYYEREAATASEKETWYEYMHRLFKNYSDNKSTELLFLIDGMDQLSRDEIAENCAFIPDGDFRHIHFVLSTVTTERMPLEYQIEISDLCEEERKQVVLGILKGKHRELSDTVIRRIIQLPNARLPLYLSLIIQRLVMMDHEDFLRIADLGEGMEAITKYQLVLIDECPGTLDELSVYIMGRASSQIGGESVKLMGYFLALSRHGLRYSDLEMLVNALRKQDGQRCKLNMVDTAAYLQYFGNFFFTRNDGRIDFTHKCFRQGLLQSAADLLPFHGLIASWLRHLPQDDEVRSQELSWHLIQADKIGVLAELQAMEPSNESLCVNMAKDLAELVTKDGGKWLLSKLYRFIGEPFFLSFSGFICRNVFFELPDTGKGLELRSIIVSTILEIEEESLEQERTYSMLWEISVNYERLSSIEREYDTDEHTEKAKVYAQKCLEIRKTLIEGLKSITTEQQQMDFLLARVAESGRRITKRPSPEQVESFVSGMLLETMRGVCVADELVARALRSQYPDTAKEAIVYLEESLSIRNEFFRPKLGGKGAYSPTLSDETYELATVHHEIAEAYEFLDDDEALKLTESHLLEAISICEETARREPSNDHIIILSQSYRLMARFIAEHRKASEDMAIELAMKSMHLMEPLYLKFRTAKEQLELSLVYHLIGDLYVQKKNGEGTAHAHEYYAKMNSLAKGLLFKTDSTEGKKAAVVAAIRDAETASDLSIEEMKKYFRVTYALAKELFDSFRNEEAYQRLEEVYMALINVIEKSRFGQETVGKRASIEVRCACLDCVFEMNNVPLPIMKQRVVEYNEMNEKIQALVLPDDAVWPEEWVELLRCIDIPVEILTIMPAYRAYDLSKKSCELARKICHMEDTLLNQDALAISLSKLASICMQVDLKEFAIVNQELMALAKELRKKTGKEKYGMMIFQAQMGAHLVDGTISEFMETWMPQSKEEQSKPENPAEETCARDKKYYTEKDLRDAFRSVNGQGKNDNNNVQTEKLAERKALEEQIQAVEEELKRTDETATFMRRVRLKKQLQELRERLAQIR